MGRLYLGTFSPVISAGFPTVVFISVCSEESFFFSYFFFPLSLFSIPPGDVDATEMHGYRSARVPEVCIEFRSRII